MTPGLPRVSVIIPHLNQPDAVLRCLAAVRAQSYPAAQIEIIIADNGSARPLDSIRHHFPDVRLVTERAPGPGLARNAGASVATGDVLAFVDADCRADPGWLAAAVDALLKAGPRGVVGGDVQIDLADANHLTGLEAYESVFAYRQKMYIEKLHFSGTGNLAMHRAVYDAVGPFAGIGVAEDRDWGRRARLLGYDVRYVPDMIVYHPARTDMADMIAKWQRQTAHDLADHRARGHGAARWIARIMAMLGITPVHALRILASNRVPGTAAKWRGVQTLLAIRRMRAREMLDQWRTGRQDGAALWNRAP